jgi:glycerol-3-phosphate acyltransferase PlsY
MWAYGLLTVVIGYLLGNLNGAFIMYKLLAHEDIRKTGSGNAGTTNIMRTLGWFPSVVTLIGDVLKAIAAILVGRWLDPAYGQFIAAVAVVCGHNWPVCFGFKGGKGIASSLGVILMTDPLIALILLVIQFGILIPTKIMSLASIASSVAYPILVAIFHWREWAYMLWALVLGVMAVYSHRANIVRLIGNRENKLDFAKITEISRKGKKN